MINLVIDMMGGDNGFKATSEAVKQFLKENDDAVLFRNSFKYGCWSNESFKRR